MKLWLFFLFFSVNAHAISLENLSKTGEGKMTYLFFTLYKAELYGTKIQNQLDQNQPIALKITYQKNISKQVLIEATQDQWLYLNYLGSDIANWLPHLVNILPNVNKQDALSLLLDSNSESYFYLNNKLIGKILDPTFGPAFLSIWLSENTSEPKLRKKLLGIKP